jgi:hypothetical protein
MLHVLPHVADPRLDLRQNIIPSTWEATLRGVQTSTSCILHAGEVEILA